jgi:adenylate kinase
MRIFELEQPKKTRIIMIGGPGSGKSTYSEILSAKLDIPHIYTGDMMRDIAKQDTPIGKKVAGLLSKGEFAPINVVMKAVQSRVQEPDARQGYILDGFPRNLEQAEKMNQLGIGYDYVVNLDVSEKEVLKRLLSRGREDDVPSVIKNRIKIYHKETAPLLDYFKDKIVNIKAEGGTPEEIANRIAGEIS